MSTAGLLASNRALSVLLLVGGVAAFAAFAQPVNPRPSATVTPAQPAQPALSDPRDQAPPSWALAAPADDADDGTVAVETPSAPVVTGQVLEQIDVAKYSYLRLGTKGRPDTWAAVPVTSAKRGQTVTITNAEPMTNFASASLKRTFDVIYFGVLDSSQAQAAGPVEHVRPGLAELAPGDDPHQPQMAPHPGPGKDADAVAVARCEKASGPLGHTVAELNALEHGASGSKARLRATVVKVTSGVMGRTFLHLRDATGTAPLTNDITATTTEDLGLGSQVLLEGTIKIDEDFGSGYRYHVLLADAHRVDP